MLGVTLEEGTGTGPQSLEKLRALYELTDRLYRAQSFEDICAAALDAITTTLRCSKASILLFDSQEVMRFVAWRNLSERYRARLTGHTPWTPGTRGAEPVIVTDIERSDEPDWVRAEVRAEGIRSLGFFPADRSGTGRGKVHDLLRHPTRAYRGRDRAGADHRAADRLQRRTRPGRNR